MRNNREIKTFCSSLICGFKVCHRGNCVDYCDIDYIELEPGETFEEDCAITKCGDDFSVTRESCGILKNESNCTLTADYSLKYPGELELN